MPRKRKVNYCKCIVICHGKCEEIFSENLKHNLKIKMYIHKRKNSSIQITSLLNELNSYYFSSIENLEQLIDIKKVKGKIHNFKVFILMDTDEPELRREMIEKYKNKRMFKNHWLKNYIVPIYFEDNFDNVLKDLGYEIDINCKTDSYRKIFPGKNGDRKAFEDLRNNIRRSQKTNLIEFLDYLAELIA
ncbi:MAG: hypothetical protein PHG08_01995 [Bacilli bacterium]|nr:hypothetical protein [Bacilli bacterium]